MSINSISVRTPEGNLQRTPRLGPLVLSAAAALALASAALFVAIRYDGASANELMRDPAAQYRLPFYAGLISNFGVAVMGCSAAITIFAAALVRDHRTHLLAAAVLTAVLAVDDLLMLHDRVGPRMLGVDELAFYLVYAVAGALVLALAFREFGLSGLLPLLLAVALLAVSIKAGFFVRGMTMTVLVGGMAKLAGFVVWSTYWIAIAYSVVRHDMRSNDTH